MVAKVRDWKEDCVDFMCLITTQSGDERYESIGILKKRMELMSTEDRATVIEAFIQRFTSISAKEVTPEMNKETTWVYHWDRNGGFIGSEDGQTQMCDFREGMGPKYGELIAALLNGDLKTKSKGTAMNEEINRREKEARQGACLKVWLLGFVLFSVVLAILLFVL